MKVLNFIKNNPNWEQILSKEPYYLKITREGNYVMLKYNQFNSNFSNPIVKECRGLIFFIRGDDIYPVCIPFYKFANHIESYADKIDWYSAIVTQKVDGSLIKLWFHDNRWNISTNGCIDAFKAEVRQGYSFGELFCDTIDFNKLTENLDKNYTYMFELTTKENRIVISYDDSIWYLGRRNNHTFKEDNYILNFDGIKIPKTYPIKNLNDCILKTLQMSSDEEGFVVRDKNFNRIKVKSKEWLLASKLRDNSVLTNKRIIEIIKSDNIDDYIAANPENKEKIEKCILIIKEYLQKLDSEYRDGLSIQDIIESNSINKNYLFGRIRGKFKSSIDYFNSLSVKAILRSIFNEN